ncbi:uncharacterized protein FOMMEDRAFT_160556 [Fomitiporia mediterranea MF3/22]|uniref:uncharacterized protein n=1 Tax=Fomitiporia mediterranea (strain MF3/22) TaxID=694068 RepID=UPI00044083F9|nr:uncharacterized protein FOMMEDRAFT_160556 [Fomitiporia mediterranea MF3/22]EJC99498.1 hypothetical protein FOMMEDRAFT_160556 [Fomitiporia mediterranea MF3/22]
MSVFPSDSPNTTSDTITFSSTTVPYPTQKPLPPAASYSMTVPPQSPHTIDIATSVPVKTLWGGVFAMFLVNIHLFASFGLSVKPAETMNVQSAHSFAFQVILCATIQGRPTSFLSLTGPTPVLADCIFDESSAWIVEVCKPGNLLSCCAKPSIPSDLKLGSMSHHVVGFSDSVTSPCRPNAYEFPIIFAFIVTVACPGSEEFPCDIEQSESIYVHSE